MSAHGQNTQGVPSAEHTRRYSLARCMGPAACQRGGCLGTNSQLSLCKQCILALPNQCVYRPTDAPVVVEADEVAAGAAAWLLEVHAREHPARHMGRHQLGHRTDFRGQAHTAGALLSPTNCPPLPHCKSPRTALHVAHKAAPHRAYYSSSKFQSSHLTRAAGSSQTPRCASIQ